MKRGAVAGCLLAGVFSALVVGNVLGEEIALGPADIILQTEEARKPARFPHRAHQEDFSCLACHHDEGEVMTAEKCGSCHGNSSDESDIISFKKLGHWMCKECHRDANEKGGDAPIKCGDCHTD